MPTKTENLKKEEYITLRDELLENKRYIFERPLLIITAGSVGLIQLLDQPFISFLPPMLIILLIINLGFTYNRLQSTIRIAAYIAVVLEPNSKVQWIGWENSLRKHRIGLNTTNKNQRKLQLDKEIEIKANYRKTLFFHSTYYLHVFSVAVAILLSFALLASNPSWRAFVGFSASLVSTSFFIYSYLHNYNPRDIRAGLETEMATWIVSLRPSGLSADQSETNHKH